MMPADENIARICFLGQLASLPLQQQKFKKKEV